MNLPIALSTIALFGGCLDDGKRSVPEETPKPTVKPRAALPSMAEAPVIQQGKLAEKLNQVKLPVPKSGEAATFRLGKETERKAWVAQLPERAQLVSVAYGDGKIFVGGGFDSNAMYALDATTGKRQWVTHSLADPGPTAVSVDGEELAFDTYSCTLAVLAVSTGKILWQKWIGSETPTQPAMTRDFVIAPHPDDMGGFSLSAFKRKNGAQAWSTSVDGHGMTAPIVSGDHVYMATTNGTLYKISLTGKRVWAQHLNALSAPWIDGDEIHMAVADKGKEAQVVLSAVDGKRLRTVTNATYAQDAPGEDTQAIWSYEGSRPVVANGVRYTAMADKVEARNARTNDLLWERSHVAGPGSRKVTSMVVAGNLAVVTTRDGKVVGLDTKTGAQRMGFDSRRRSRRSRSSRRAGCTSPRTRVRSSRSRSVRRRSMAGTCGAATPATTCSATMPR